MTCLCMSVCVPSALYLFSLFAPVGNGLVGVGGEKKVAGGGGRFCLLHPARERLSCRPMAPFSFMEFKGPLV